MKQTGLLHNSLLDIYYILVAANRGWCNGGSSERQPDEVGGTGSFRFPAGLPETTDRRGRLIGEDAWTQYHADLPPKHMSNRDAKK